MEIRAEIGGTEDYKRSLTHVSPWVPSDSISMCNSC